MSCNSYSDKKLFKMNLIILKLSMLIIMLHAITCMDRINSEILIFCQFNKRGRHKMSTSESQHVVDILKAFFFFKKAIEPRNRELLFYSKFCKTSNWMRQRQKVHTFSYESSNLILYVTNSLIWNRVEILYRNLALHTELHCNCYGARISKELEVEVVFKVMFTAGLLFQRHETNTG